MFGGRSCSWAVGEEAGAEGWDGVDEEDLVEVVLLVMERAAGWLVGGVGGEVYKGCCGEIESSEEQNRVQRAQRKVYNVHDAGVTECRWPAAPILVYGGSLY